MKKWFSSTIEDNPKLSRDVIRRYIEGEATPDERRSIQNRLRESDEWRREYARQERYLNALRALPMHSPPERVWKSIENRVNNTNPQAVWFPWIYTRSARAMGIRACTLLLLMATLALLLLMGSPQTLEPSFEIVAVDDINGFGKEAETYIAYHDFKNGSAETLIAFNTDNWPQ